MFLGLILLWSIQGNVIDTTSRASNSFWIVILSILKQSCLICWLRPASYCILLANTRSGQLLVLQTIVHVCHLYLMQLKIVWSSFDTCFLLYLSNLLSMLHGINVILSNSCIEVKVTTCRLLIHIIHWLIHKFLVVRIWKNCVSSYSRRPFNLHHANLSCQQVFLLRVLLGSNLLIKLLLFKDNIHTPPDLSVSVSLLAGMMQILCCLRCRNHRTCCTHPTHPLSLRDGRLLIRVW